MFENPASFVVAHIKRRKTRLSRALARFPNTPATMQTNHVMLSARPSYSLCPCLVFVAHFAIFCLPSCALHSAMRLLAQFAPGSRPTHHQVTYPVCTAAARTITFVVTVTVTIPATRSIKNVQRFRVSALHFISFLERLSVDFLNCTDH